MVDGSVELNNTVVIEKKMNPVAAFFDRFFHFSERGGTLGSEIGAGLAAFLIASASFIMNAQIIGSVYGNYAGSYLAITLMAMLGTILLGVLTNRPLVYSANLALSTSMVSLIGANSGMTYANLLVVTTFASLIALGISISPLGSKLATLLPVSVRKALPIAIGLLVMSEALTQSGLVSSTGGLFTVKTGGDSGLQSLYLVMALISVVAFIVLKALKVRKVTFRIYGVLVGLMWAFGIIFFTEYFIGGQTATTLVYQRVNLFFSTDGANCYNIGLGFQSIKWGELFTKGFDFSGVENAGLVWIKCLVMYTIFGVFANIGYLHANATVGDYVDEKTLVEKTRLVNVTVNAANVAGAVIFSAPMSTVAPASSVISDNEGKTGLSSIICGIGFFVLLFTWITFGLTATNTNGVGMWIENSETKLAAYVQDTFLFADVVMALVGALMLKAIKNLDIKNARELVAVIATVCGTLFARDVAFGIALGVIADVIFSFVDKKDDDKLVTNLSMGGVMILYVIFAVL